MTFSPNLGRWLERDPIEADFNTYRAFSDNPADRIDPLGLDDWNFTPAKYEALKKSGGSLSFGSDSKWFPKKLQDNLIATLDFVLSSKDPIRTNGVNLQDFYHGHFIIPKAGKTDALRKRINEFYNQSHELEAGALGGKWYNDVTEENVKAYSKAIEKIEPLATPILDDAIKIGGAAVLYHTFEYSGPKIRPGSPIRNIFSSIENCQPRGYDPSGTEASADQYQEEFSDVLQFAFLVDEKGVIHVTIGGKTQLSRVTGSPTK